MKRTLMLAALALGGLIAPPARAHFLWLTSERDGAKAQVHAFLSETPLPDLPEFLKTIEKSKITVGGKPVEWTKGENTFLVALPEPKPATVDGFCDLGVMARGGTPFRLLYTARVQFAPVPASEPELEDNLRVRVVAGEDRKPALAVTFKGKPVADALVKIFPADGEMREAKSDAEGRVDAAEVAQPGAGFLAKWIDPVGGDFNGKEFKDSRYYATLTIAGEAPKAAAAAADADEKAVAAAPASEPFAVLPEAINSFGGAVAGDYLYAYSGHIGETHRYSTETTTKHFRRINLKERKEWEELPCGPALQGMTLLSHNGKLYRVGGMAAHNEPGKLDNLVSVADFAKFDPETKEWTDLPSLPEPRSTHDAVVVGDYLYVVGGWSMPGGEAIQAAFCEDALRFDLSKPDSSWEVLPTPPFQRRALGVASLQGKIYVLGGLTEDGKVASTVDIYDPAKQEWSKGPDLPGGRFQGFAASAFEVDDRLYVNGSDGIVYRLSPAGDGWESFAKLAVPRLTHRLLPGINHDLLAVGGNFAGTPVRIVESVSTRESQAGPVSVSWTAPNEGPAVQGQALAVVRTNLLAVGGNRSAAPHAFKEENLVSEGAQFALNRLNTEATPSLPAPRQSGVLVVVTKGRGEGIPGRGGESTPYLLGGIGPDGDVTRTLGDVFRFDAKEKQWTRVDASIPDARGMFGAVSHEGKVWVFGGSIFDPRPGQEKRPMPLEVLKWDTNAEGSNFEVTEFKIPHARRSFGGAALDGKYYLVGGLGADQKIVEDVDVFDLKAGTWSTIPAPAQPRLFADLATLNGKLYLAGGFSKGGEEGGHFQPNNSVEEFDPKTGKWTTVLEASPVANSRLLTLSNRLLFFGVDPKDGGKAQFALVAP